MPGNVTYSFGQSLWKWGLLPIPGIGVIKSKYSPAHPNWHTSEFYPPVLQYVFEPWSGDTVEMLDLKKNDPDYVDIITGLSIKWTEELKKGSPVEISGVGTLSYSNSGELVFESDKVTSLPAYFDSLKKVPFKLEVDRSKLKVPVAGHTVKYQATKRPFGKWFTWAALIFILLSVAYWITTPDYYEPPIPNGRVNFKPGTYTDESTEVNNQPQVLADNLETSDLPDDRTNVTPSVSNSSVELVPFTSCTIIVGSFLKPYNSQRLLNKMRSKGFEATLIPFDSFTRVGVTIDCRHTASQLEEIRRLENKDAWLLDN